MARLNFVSFSVFNYFLRSGYEYIIHLPCFEFTSSYGNTGVLKNNVESFVGAISLEVVTLSLIVLNIIIAFSYINFASAFPW